MTPPQHPALALLLLAALAMGTAWATDIEPPPLAPAPGSAQAGKPSVSTKEAIRPAPVRSAPAPRVEASPTWAELAPPQQQALAPLSATWRTLGESHKRKWLALSENFATMPPPEQARLHSRMTEWAALSPRQRTAARLNFAEAQKVAPTDKRAKWEAYQALSPEEKKKFAAGAAKPVAPPTAIAVQPVAKEKLAKIPPKAKKGEPPAKLAVVPGPAGSNTLLPAPAAPAQP